jgi:hypothetical protein
VVRPREYIVHCCLLSNAVPIDVRHVKTLEPSHPHAYARVCCAIGTQAVAPLADGLWTQQRRAGGVRDRWDCGRNRFGMGKVREKNSAATPLSRPDAPYDSSTEEHRILEGNLPSWIKHLSPQMFFLAAVLGVAHNTTGGTDEGKATLDTTSPLAGPPSLSCRASFRPKSLTPADTCNQVQMGTTGVSKYAKTPAFQWFCAIPNIRISCSTSAHESARQLPLQHDILLFPAVPGPHQFSP